MYVYIYIYIYIYIHTYIYSASTSNPRHLAPRAETIVTKVLFAHYY